MSNTYTLQEAILSERERKIILAGDINESQSRIMIQTMQFLSETSKNYLVEDTFYNRMASKVSLRLCKSNEIHLPIELLISTTGGEIQEAFSIYDYIKIVQKKGCPVITTGIGKVMSAGVLILASGDEGSRFLTQNTRVMIHEVSGGVFGTVGEMEDSLEETRKLQNIFIDLIAKETGFKEGKLIGFLVDTHIYLNQLYLFVVG
jgi:ATP-dependent protease ClpP protease subunit